MSRVLRDESFAGEARRIVRAMEEERREDRAVAELEALAAQSRVGKVTPLAA